MSQVTKILETERLVLRTWTLSDADMNAAYALWSDPEVKKDIIHHAPESLDDIRKTVQAGAKHQEEFGTQLWAVVEKISGQLIGCCGFILFEDGPAYELVCHLARPYWRLGYATELAEAVLEYAFEKLRIPRVVATLPVDNLPSRKILEKAGFEYLGTYFWQDVSRELYHYEMSNPLMGKA